MVRNECSQVWSLIYVTSLLNFELLSTEKIFDCLFLFSWNFGALSSIFPSFVFFLDANGFQTYSYLVHKV